MGIGVLWWGSALHCAEALVSLSRVECVIGRAGVCADSGFLWQGDGVRPRHDSVRGCAAVGPLLA